MVTKLNTTADHLTIALEKSNRDRRNLENRIDSDRFLPNIKLYNQINSALSAHVSSLREAPSDNARIDLVQLNTQVATDVVEKPKSKKIGIEQAQIAHQNASAQEMANSFMQSSIDRKLHTLLLYLISESKNPIETLELKKLIEKGLFGATKKQHSPEQIEKSLDKLLTDNADLILKNSHLNITVTLKNKLGLKQNEPLLTKKLDHSEEKKLETGKLETEYVTHSELDNNLLELDNLSQDSFKSAIQSEPTDSNKSVNTAFYSAKSTEKSNSRLGIPTFISAPKKRADIMKQIKIINLDFIKSAFVHRARSQYSTHSGLSNLSEKTIVDPMLQRFSKLSEMSARFRNEMRRATHATRND